MMTMTLHEAACSTTYEEVELMLRKVVMGFVTPHFPPDELMSVANMTFMECYNGSWDPNRGTSFSSWLYGKVRFRIMDHIRNSQKRHERVEDVEVELLVGCPSDYELLSNELSPLASSIVKLLLTRAQSPGVLRSYLLAPNKDGKVRQRLKRFAARYVKKELPGLDDFDIDEVMGEVAGWLQNKGSM